MTRLRSNGPCWCGSGKKFKRCHGDHVKFRRSQVRPGCISPEREVPESIPRPEYVLSRRSPVGGADVQIHRGESLERMRRAGRIAAEVLQAAGAAVAAGVTTEEIDQVAHDAYVARGSYPSDLNYKGYRKSLCTSVNEVVCHGIPDDRPLQPGDIVNLDVTAYVDGVHGDTSATFAVGELDAPTAALVQTTHEALMAGIGAVAPGRDLRCIAEAIQPLAHSRGFGVIREYGGHGIGTVFHAAPHVNHGIEASRPFVLEPGMTFTIEPMLTAGVNKFHTWDDDWTVVTDDFLPSAQFEHTIVVTEDGAEILTSLD